MLKLYCSIIAFLLWAVMLVGQTTTKPEVGKAPLFADWRVELDVANLLTNALYKGERYAYEGSVQTLVRNKFFAVGELGYGGSEKLNLDNANMTSSGMYGRLGIDFNLMKPKPDALPSRNYFLAGLRLGMSGYNYELSNVLLVDDYWEEARLRSYPQKYTVSTWFEVLASARVEVFSNVYLGWTVRLRNMIGEAKPGAINAWYVPGYGRTGQSVWTVNYSVGYRF